MAQGRRDPARLRALAHPTRIALLEVLRVHSPLTATEAGELIGVSPTNCAFHLRALARFGFVEEAGRGPGRRRPWRATDAPTAFSDVQPDEESAAAARALSDVLISHWLGRTAAAQAARDQQPAAWREVLGGSQTVAHATVAEVHAMVADIRDVLGRYDDRLRDPSLRPDDSQPVELLLFAQPYTP